MVPIAPDPPRRGLLWAKSRVSIRCAGRRVRSVIRWSRSARGFHRVVPNRRTPSGRYGIEAQRTISFTDTNSWSSVACKPRRKRWPNTDRSRRADFHGRLYSVTALVRSDSESSRAAGWDSLSPSSRPGAGRGGVLRSNRGSGHRRETWHVGGSEDGAC